MENQIFSIFKVLLLGNFKNINLQKIVSNSAKNIQEALSQEFSDISSQNNHHPVIQIHSSQRVIFSIERLLIAILIQKHNVSSKFQNLNDSHLSFSKEEMEENQVLDQRSPKTIKVFIERLLPVDFKIFYQLEAEQASLNIEQSQKYLAKECLKKIKDKAFELISIHLPIVEADFKNQVLQDLEERKQEFPEIRIQDICELQEVYLLLDPNIANFPFEQLRIFHSSKDLTNSSDQEKSVKSFSLQQSRGDSRARSRQNLLSTNSQYQDLLNLKGKFELSKFDKLKVFQKVQRIPSLLWLQIQQDKNIVLNAKNLGYLHYMPFDNTLNGMHEDFDNFYKKFPKEFKNYKKLQVKDELQMAKALKRYPINIYSGHNDCVEEYVDALTKHSNDQACLAKKLQFQIGCESLMFRSNSPATSQALFNSKNKVLDQLLTFESQFVFGLQWSGFTSFLDQYTHFIIEHLILRNSGHYMKDKRPLMSEDEDEKKIARDFQNIHCEIQEIMHKQFKEDKCYNIFGRNLIAYGLFQKFK